MALPLAVLQPQWAGWNGILCCLGARHGHCTAASGAAYGVRRTERGLKSRWIFASQLGDEGRCFPWGPGLIFAAFAAQIDQVFGDSVTVSAAPDRGTV